MKYEMGMKKKNSWVCEKKIWALSSFMTKYQIIHSTFKRQYKFRSNERNSLNSNYFLSSVSWDKFNFNFITFFMLFVTWRSLRSHLECVHELEGFKRCPKAAQPVYKEANELFLSNWCGSSATNLIWSSKTSIVYVFVASTFICKIFA